MELLVIALWMPYPLSEGGRISQFAILDQMRKKHRITLVLVSLSKEDDRHIEQLQALWPEITIKVILLYNNEQPVIIEKYSITQKLKKRAVRSLLGYLSRKKPQPKKAVPINSFSEGFLNVNTLKEVAFIEKISKILSEDIYDIIQVDIIEFSDIAYLLPQNIKKVFVHHEIRFARMISGYLNEGKKLDVYQEYLVSYVRSKEIMLLNLYDAIFVFSEEDKKKLEIEMPGKKIMVAPFPVLESSFREIKDENANIVKLVFVGGENHQPNKDAVEWYINEITHLVSSKCDLKLHIVGHWTEKTIEQYDSVANVIFEGFIPDLVSFCNNSIMIVPIKSGSGIRAKILYAMAQGVPVISTSIGCEGIKLIHGESILIANKPVEFANAIERILRDKNLTLSISRNAQEIIRSNYSQAVVGELRDKLFEELLKQ